MSESLWDLQKILEDLISPLGKDTNISICMKQQPQMGHIVNSASGKLLPCGILI